MKAWPLLFANVIDGADVGMIERGGGLGFAPEALQGLRVAGDVFRKKFQRDEAAEAGVLGLIDHAHTAAAKLFEDAVMGNGLTDEGGSVRHPRAL